MKEVKAIGVQRTGTNYIEYLLRENFEVYSHSCLEVFWKHALPSEVPNLKRKIEQRNLILIIVRKPFDLWYKSISKYKADFHKRRFDVYGNYNKMFAFYKKWYIDWIIYCERNGIQYEVLEYLDVVENFSAVLSKWKKKFNLNKKARIYKNVHKVPQSQKFTDSVRQKYLKYKKHEI